MTIIKSSQYLSNYPYQALSNDVVSLLKNALSSLEKQTTPETTVKLFECYCHITGQQIRHIDLHFDSCIRSTVRGFIGALHSDDFVDVSIWCRRYHAYTFIQGFNYIRNTSIPALKDLQWSTDFFNECSDDWQRHELDPDAVQYWGGWSIYTRKNKVGYLRLAPLYHSHGKEFTTEFHNAWGKFHAKRATAKMTTINVMADYLSEHYEHWPASTFRHPVKLHQFFLAFMRHYFLTTHAKKQDLNQARRIWGKFIANINEVFVESGVWTQPFEALPKPEAKATPGAKTKIRKTEDGTVEVSEKLITDVPLKVTDDQAINILFKQISADIKTVKDWAEVQAQDLYSRCQRRKTLAQNGNPIDGGTGTKHLEDIGLANICATFERDGFVRDENYLRSRFGQPSITPRPLVAKLLGLPTANSLFPYQSLLVAEQPKITRIFLEELELYNKQGQLSGFLKTDGGYQLIGYKDRQGKVRSEQKVDLTEQSAEWVKQVIEITAPLRAYLKAKRSDAWRCLFLTCDKGFGKPKRATTPKWCTSFFNNRSKKFERLINEFQPHTEMGKDALKNFLLRVSLGRIRSSCGVEIYIETGSVEKMAEALGHAKYNPNLLSHYLPEPLLAFFQTRWVRIFQKGFVCHAMKDSPYLLEATQFESMAELHEFLQNHALKGIPDHRKRSGGSKDNSEVCEVYVGIDTGVLTALISLERAVSASAIPEKINAKARFWAKASRLIAAQIQSEQDPDLCRYLRQANEHADELIMEELIYAAS
ncbi:MAG: hypothetical protein V7707_18340 [Motiliproteus sp.]